MNPWILALGAIALAIVCARLLAEALMIRRVSRRIDDHFRRLSQPPSWRLVDSADEIPDEVLQRLRRFEGVCERELGFVALCRLREFSAADELLGLRTVLLSPDRRIAATFACSHLRPQAAFRSFGARSESRCVYVSDAKSLAFTLPEHFLVEPVTRMTAEITMHARLSELLKGLADPLIPFENAESYVAWQRQIWEDKNAFRAKTDFVIDLPSLRKLAPARISDERLMRIQKAVARRHRPAAR